MMNTVTQQPLRVQMTAESGPYLDFAHPQYDDIKRALDKHGITYWLSPAVITFPGKLPMTVLYFGRMGDPQQIQAALDQHP